MKLSKSLFLAFAGLGLFACSNEEIADNGGVQGDATVSVAVNLPKLIMDSRSGGGITAQDQIDGTTGTETPVLIGEKGIVVTLHAASGDLSVTKNSNEEAFTFTGVRNPVSIEVSVNGGSSTKLNIDQINAAGLAAPLYGTSSDFKYVENEKKYTVEVTPAPRYARLELSKITKDNNHTNSTCIFTQAQLGGLFLDNLWVTEGEPTRKINVSANKTIWDNISTNTYYSPTWSPIGQNFMAGYTFPYTGNGENKCYAYSVFEGDLPKVVFALDGRLTRLANNVTMVGYQVGDDLYATVSKYKINKPLDWDQNKESYMSKYGVDENGYFTTFKAGNIYQISDIAIPDAAWGTTPGVDNKVDVEAKVNVLPWVIVDGTVDWN